MPWPPARPSSQPTYAARPTRGIGMTKRLFDHAQTATLDEQLALEARAPDGGDEDGGLRGGRGRLPGEAPAELQRPLSVDRDRRLPHRRRAVPDRHRRRRAARGPRRSSSSAGSPQEQLDHVRRLLVFEPRGHADMYGCFVTEPEDGGADLGVVFFHNAGYSTACGHGTIALVTWAIESGRRCDGPEVVVDVPSGRLRDRSTRRGRPCRVGALPQRAGVRARARPPRLPDARWTSPSAARSMPRCEEQVEPAELPRLIELGRCDQGRSRARRTRSSIRTSRSCATSTA